MKKESLDRIDLCEFKREENSDIETGILLNGGSLGIIDIKGGKVEKIWNYEAKSAFAIEIGKLL